MRELKEHKAYLFSVIQEAGELALEYFNKLDSIKVNHKSPKDLVTEADIQVESFIKQKLNEKFPAIGFFGEETGRGEVQADSWIVDPIDGTHSFFRGQHQWSLSIALQLDSEICLGAVYAPALNDLYIAEKGYGAFKNGNQIHVSTINTLSEAMVCTGFACLRSSLEDNNLERFCRVALKTRDQRRLGSAAKEICMVADGTLDVFWEQNLNLYDVAAGSVIALEAGATVTNFKGEEGVFPKEILVTNGKLIEEMVPLM